MKKKTSVVSTLVQVSVIPVIILGIILTLMTYNNLDSTIVSGIENELAGTAKMLYSNIKGTGNGRINYFKGKLESDGILLNGDAIVQRVKEDTGNDATIFWGDKRVATTIINSDGKSAVGTKASKAVVSQVIDGGMPYFSTHADINGEKYYGYYIPVINRDGKTVAMVFAGCEADKAAKLVDGSTKQVLGVSVLSIILAIFLAAIIMKRIIYRFLGLRDYMQSISEGDFVKDIDHRVFSRDDELADMGNNLVSLRSHLQDAVFTDTLTGLLNAKACEYRMERWLPIKEKSTEFFCISLIDLDGFESINNTYGHECGDLVLQEMAKLILTVCDEHAIIGRLKGDEFFVAQKATMREMNTIMIALQSIIREDIVIHDANEIRMQATIAIMEYNFDYSVERNLREVDILLREGKAQGKDCIVRQDAVKTPNSIGEEQTKYKEISSEKR